MSTISNESKRGSTDTDAYNAIAILRMRACLTVLAWAPKRQNSLLVVSKIKVYDYKSMKSARTA
jgi:hypothetical protein